MSPTPPRADIYETRFPSWLAESIMAALPNIRLQPTAAGAMTWSVIAFPVSPAHQRVEASNYPFCVSPGNHQHSMLPDERWASAWLQMQSQVPEVNIRARRQRSARRADLYIVARRQVVSLEFKYADARGLRGIDACISQLRRHAQHHARALFVVYSTSPEMLDEARIGSNLPSNASVAVVGGPPISVVRGAA